MGARLGLTIGGVRLRVTERVERCRMVDVDQVGVRPEARWLTLLGAEREVCAAVYAQVVTPGLLRVGATVQA